MNIHSMMPVATCASEVVQANPEAQTPGVDQSAQVNPKPLTRNVRAWKPAQLSPCDYVLCVDDAANENIKNNIEALAQAHGGIGGDNVDIDSFPVRVDTLKELIAKAKAELSDHNGFCVIRGIDSKDYNDVEHMAAFLGIASHVGGDLRGVQDRQANVLAHITHSKKWDIPLAQRHGIHTNRPLAIHTDMGASVLALHVRCMAREGGQLFVTSGTTIHDELKARDAEALQTLMDDQWPVQTHAEPAKSTTMPLMQEDGGRVTISFDPGRLGLHDGHMGNESKNRVGNIPSLTKAQARAYTVLGDIARANSLRLDLQPGDMVFINNWAVAHGRDAYIDGDFDRHMVRLWLHDSKAAWDVPQAQKEPWEWCFGVGGNPLQDRTRGKQRRYPLAPVEKLAATRFTVGSAGFFQ